MQTESLLCACQEFLVSQLLPWQQSPWGIPETGSEQLSGQAGNRAPQPEDGEALAEEPLGPLAGELTYHWGR